MDNKKPTLLVFAGPNGSGKSTVTKMLDVAGVYINADNIQAAMHCDTLSAARIAEEQRNKCLEGKLDFTFETVFSTRTKLDFLTKAKQQGYFIKCFYILTADPGVNISRVEVRVRSGGHDVPEDKIVSRYYKALSLIPELVSICDIINIYDNTKQPCRIFSKKKDTFRVFENPYWNETQIAKLTKISAYTLIKLE